jgi:hypothetical protein
VVFSWSVVECCVAEAASVHQLSLFTRLRVVYRELRQAEAKLDTLWCAAIGETDADSGAGLQRQDVMILRSMHPASAESISRPRCARDPVL